MNSFDELCKKLTQDVANTIVQGRSWNEAEQFRFDYAVRHLLIGLWKKHHTHPDNHSSINQIFQLIRMNWQHHHLKIY